MTVLLSLLLPTQAYTIQCPSKAVPDSYFGVHLHRFHDPRLLPGNLFGTWRLWDAGVDWRDVEPARDTWTWERLDLALKTAEQLNMEPVLVLGATPRWASQRPQEPAALGPGAAAPPAQIADWERYVDALTSRYKSRIKYYEIWNEPHSTLFYTGSVAEMVDMASKAWEVIRRNDPDAKVISPSTTSNEGIEWLDSYGRSGGLAFADVAGFHFYTNREVPEQIIPLALAVEEIVARWRPGLPIWNTESGFTYDKEDSAEAGYQNVPGSGSAIARALLLAWCTGVERYYYYAWDNTSYGMVDWSNGHPTDTLFGWLAMQSLMRGARFETCSEATSAWRCAFRSPSGAHGAITWSDTDNQAAMPTMTYDAMP